MMDAAECIAECLCSGNSLVYSHFDMDSFQLTDFADVSTAVTEYSVYDMYVENFSK